MAKKSSTVYIEENVLQEAMADFILVGLKLKISQKTEEKKSSRENTGGKRKTPSQSFHSKKKMLSDIYEAYAEGKIDKDTFLRGSKPSSRHLRKIFGKCLRQKMWKRRQKQRW